MMTMIREGGWPMWFLVLFGLVALGAGAQLVARPTRRGLARLKGLCVTVAAASIVGVAADLGAVFAAMIDIKDQPGWYFYMLQGFKESMAPLIMGFAFLALAALLGAVGAGRIADEAT